MYSASDLTPIDPIEWVRENPQRIFRAGRFSAVEAAALIALSPLAEGSKDVRIRREDDWWIVSAEQDWLRPPLDTTVFESLVPDPNAGPNGAYWEIVLTAHASGLVTATRDGVRVVKGDAPAPTQEQLLPGAAARAVAFQP